VDRTGGGRLEVGLGAGSPMSEADSRAYGIPFGAMGERIGRLGEVCRILRLLWLEPSVSFSGRYYRLEDARPVARPVQQPGPPLWVGGGSERVLRIAARHTGSCTSPGRAERFPELPARLRTLCAELGRDPATLRLSAQFFLRDRPAAEVRADLDRYEQAGADGAMAVINLPYTEAEVERA